MTTLSPSPSSPLAVPPASNVTLPPQPSTSPPDSTPVINANPPDPSITLTPPPAQPASPPPVSPPPLDTPSSPPPAASSIPPAPATSQPPPNSDPSPPPPPPPVDAPPPSTPTISPPPPTTADPPLTSPPSPSTGTPIVPSPPSDPPSSPPPPATKPTPRTPSTLHPPHASPPPPTSKAHPPTSQSPPPPLAGVGTKYAPPPSTSPPVGRQASTPPSPKVSPSTESPPPVSPTKNSPPSPSTRTNVSLLSPPPLVSPTPSSHISSSAPNPLSGDSTASSVKKGGVSEGGVVAIGVVVGIVMLGLIGMVVLYISKRRRRTSIHNGGYVVPSPYGSSPRSDSNLLVKTQGSTPFGRSGSGSGLGQSRSWFTYQELYEATNGFSSGSLLGEGGFGVVYKGILTNGREVAVKQLKTGGGEGEREFRSEVETISRIHHRHLVSLVGYCIYENKWLLVYEYVPNQTLHYHLHGEGRLVMDWATRLKIAKGAARGIAYLHEDCHPRIIHRDIKSSNILLDNRFEACVSDFGTARLALDADTHISTRVMGTFGYMAPEYATSGKLTDKSDVYSFGVVLLELITGRKPVDESQPIGDESLVEWARPLLSHVLETGQVEGLVDSRLEKNYVECELILMIEAAAACVRHLATKRPRMGQVVRAFDSLSPSDLSNGMRVGQSEIYDSAQQSADIRWFRRMAFGSHEYSTDYFSEATRNTDRPNPTQTDQGAVFSAQQSPNDPPQQGEGFSTQQRRNDPSLQQSQNIYFSAQRAQRPALSPKWSQNPSIFRPSSQDPISRQLSSQDLDPSGRQSERS